MEALGINGGFLVAQIVNFLIIFLLLSLAWRRVLKMLDDRQRRIAEGLENARKADERLANAQADYDRKMAEADEAARRRIDEAVARAEEAAKAVRAEAEAEAQRIRERALEDAQAERNRLLADMRGQVAALAIAAANKLLGEAMDESRQRRLVADFFAKVPGEVRQLSGEIVEVTSALPLTDAEKKAAQEQIGAKEITFKVDPSLLGGVVVRAGDRIIDDSYAGQLRRLQQQLQ